MSDGKMTSREAAVALCRALDIDPTTTSRIELEMQAGEMAVLMITRYVSREQIEALGAEIQQRFDLVPRDG